MKTILLTTLSTLAVLLPFIIRDGRRYRVILMGLVLLLPFYQSFIYLRYLTILFLAVVVWQGDDRYLFRSSNEPINRSMMVFYVAGAVSTLFTANMTQNTSIALIDLAFYYLFFLLCLVALKNQLLQPQLPVLLLIGLIVSVFIATMQLLGFEAFYLFDEKELNTNTGMLYEAEDRILRFWGPFGNSLTFSAYLAIVGTFLFGYYRTSAHRRTRLISVLSLVLTLYGIMLTAGRTALLSVVAGLLFYAFLKNWKRSLTVTAALVITLLLSLDYMDRAMSDAGLSIYARFINFGQDKGYRAKIWESTWSIFQENPLFGTGPGNLVRRVAPLIDHVYTFEKEALSLTWGHVENTYLTVLLTFGLLGFVCFAFMLVKSFQYSLRACRNAVPPPIRQTGYGLVTSWFVMSINMITNPIFVVDPRMIALMLMMVALSILVGWQGRKSVRLTAVQTHRLPEVSIAE